MRPIGALVLCILGLFVFFDQTTSPKEKRVHLMRFVAYASAFAQMHRDKECPKQPDLASCVSKVNVVVRKAQDFIFVTQFQLFGSDVSPLTDNQRTLLKELGSSYWDMIIR